MQEKAKFYISQAKYGNNLKQNIRQIVTIFSLAVALIVFWSLKLTGITIAGEAFCGKQEHQHSEACASNCAKVPHIHDATCYSNIQEDIETHDDWELMLADVVRSGTTAEDVVAVARSQLGYEESVLNFQVDANDIRRGITRYGQWYGNPYGDWSAMFVAFCLHYAGVDQVPTNAGPQSMRLQWEQAGLYRPAESYTPHVGDVLFLSKDRQGADAVAIITGFDGEMITVIEGNVDDRVAEVSYSVLDPVVLGYGLVPDLSEPVIMLATEGSTSIARTIAYQNNIFTADRSFVVYTTFNGKHYAIDGSGNAVPIEIDASGNISCEVEDTAMLLWSFSGSRNNYTIRNLSSGRYMHAYAGDGGGVTTASAYTSTLVASGNGVKIRSNNSDYARINVDDGKFVVTQNANLAAVYQFGYTNRCTVWLDGTAGGQGQLAGSEDKSYSVMAGATFQLPTSWKTPEKYQQRLKGWYDVTNQRYYAAGERIIVTGDMVLYADWVAATYDVGVYNAQVADTVSTKSFITTHVFDYNYLFNVLSSNANVTVSDTAHQETWSMVQNGTVNYGGNSSLEFVFVDYDGGSRLTDVSNRNDNNNYLGEGIVTPGIYTPALGELLFSTDQDVIGKTYVGTGDHLYRYMSDPDDEYYGYYFYDSRRNAASYNQSDGRFYVYEYLAATSDSVNSAVASDFLPFNSPYANTNGKTVRSYSYAGVNGEYSGVTHYRYDSKYSDSNNSASYVATNYAFGMRTDVSFYLPVRPGSVDEQGNTGNKDVYGKDMYFHFQGDDDVWVLVDGVLVLDIGGIHGIEGGGINFATGIVTVNDQVDQNLSRVVQSIEPGEHTLTIMYLERGSSQSNAAFYFNLAPRYSLQLQKEDVLTQQQLNGAQFSVFTDVACTSVAKLYTDEASYYAGQTPRNTFTVANGRTDMWGLAAGNTYYIKETRGPDVEGYGCAKGMIRLVIDKDGLATYHVDVIADTDGTAPSAGFTVHGVRIDEETQSAYIVVTNAPETVIETTTVQVFKKWEDTKDHSGDYITAYLTVTDPDGTVRRIRQIVLSHENNWLYTWTNLPKCDYEALTEVQYGVEESYESGYYSTVRKVTEIVIQTTTWAEAVEFVNGQSYIMKTQNGYLSTTGGGADVGYQFVDEETAKTSPYARWVAHRSGNNVKLTNEAGQSITFYYNNGNPTDFFAYTSGENNESKQYFRWASTSTGLRLYYDAPNNRDYYLSGSMNSSQKFGYSNSANDGLIFTPMTQITATDVVEVQDWAYQIINTPLAANNETSVTVSKYWDLGMSGKVTDYEQAQVTVKLYANGLDTGRIVTLSLKNGWKASFLGLPYRDGDGNIIQYTVLENWDTPYWRPVYGPVYVTDGNLPKYSTSITNTHVSVGGPELPSTGTAGRLIFILCGAGIMAGSLVYAIALRCKRKGGSKKST